LAQKAVKLYFSGYLLENNLMKIKDFYLGFLNENKDFFYVDAQSVGAINDINIDKADDYIKIDFETSYGKPASLVAKYHQFKHWYQNNINKHQNAFKAFVQEYLTRSKEQEQAAEMNEIIDDDGNIMSSDDKPNNSTNSMVGAKNTWDLDRVYKSSIPKSIRFYSGDLGVGIVTW
jgi:hypothetical protein